MKHRARFYLMMIVIGGIFTVPLISFAISVTPLSNQQAVEAVDIPWPKSDIPTVLNWTPTHGTMCSGYYAEPDIVRNYPTPPPLGKGKVTITATKPVIYSQTGTSTLEGDVTVTQIGREITADKAYIYRDPQTGKINGIDLIGNVHYREIGKLIIARTAHIDMVNNVVTLHYALYRFEKAQSFDILNAWGTMRKGVREGNGVLNLKHATYTTCPPTAKTWEVSASSLHLDKESGRGTATNSILKVQGMPVFYMPYFNFPIDRRRKTGFLFPTVSYTEDSGFDLTIPYYLNLAPNYDDLIQTDIYTLRGVQGTNDFRYLTGTNTGETIISVLPNDSVFSNFQKTAPNKYALVPNADAYLSRLENASDTRTAFSYQDNGKYNDHWSSLLNLNYVSDDYYLQDFASTPQQINTDQLVNQADVNYRGENWQFLGRLQGYQTLHPINEALIVNQYNHLPQFDLNADYPDQPYGLEYLLNSEIVRFDQQNNFITRDPVVSGDRLHFAPGISLPLANTAGYFTPTLQLDETAYNLQNQTPGDSASINRTLPIFDIDSGLFFRRDIHFLSHQYEQTLEPRLFYLWVPLTNQNDIPLFDTNLPPFSYGQLFQTNRFVGLDRIGDANQLTAAVTTRFLDSYTGQEKMHASVGEIYYFHQPGVCDTTNCSNDTTIGSTISPIVSELSYNINPHYNLTGDWAWNPNEHETETAAVNFNYQNELRRLYTIGYSFVQNGDTLNTSTTTNVKNLNRFNIGASYPLNSRWSLMANWNYNISRNHAQAYFYGAEYNTCCWAVRLLASRSIISDDPINGTQYDTTYYVQFQLKGLGNIGNNDPSTILKSTLPGYQDTFG